MNFLYPNITEGTPSEQIGQLKNFLFQLVEQLNLQGSGSAAPTAETVVRKAGSLSAGVSAASPTGQFNQLKSLIIKSADIVNAFYEEINKRLEKKYEVLSAFGTYKEDTLQLVTANAEKIERLFSKSEEITNTVGEIESLIYTEATIRQGKLFTVNKGNGEDLDPELGQELSDGDDVYGIEIGQKIEKDGVEIFDKFARFTAYGVTFYNGNGTLAAYITNNQLKVPNVKIEISLTRGGFIETVEADGGRVERWVGL